MQQGIKFSSIDDFLEFLPPGERRIVDVLRGILLDAIPNVSERLSYNVPFYYRHSRVCFIWPSSVPWGGVKSEGVALGFCRGNLIRDESEFLEKGERKEVYTKTFFSLDEVDTSLLLTYIEEAVAIDDSHLRRK